ncbi:hypothetical protein [Pyrococcus sp. ST04]
MLAATLILVALVFRVVMSSMQSLSTNLGNYTRVIRQKVLENL